MEIYIHEATGKMVNIYAPFGGFSRLDTTEIRTKAGVIAIEEDAQPVDYDPSFYDRREDWEATQRPYIIYTKKPDDQIKAIQDERIKAKILALESQQGRAIREAVLTGDKTRLTALDAEIAALRAQL